MARTFHIVNLGCPKNRVDSEVIWATAAAEGLAAVEDPGEADVIVVNTCAFIQSAVSESLDTILEMSRYKQEGRCSLLVVAGCLTARYGRRLRNELSEVDLFVGPAEAGKLGKWLGQWRYRDVSRQKGSITGRFSYRQGQAFLQRLSTPRANSLSSGAAYLKVAEGCSRSCSFCIIPRLRGPQCSRRVEDLVGEAAGLVRLGVREIILVAQDLVGWGSDLPGKPGLADLVDALADVPGIRWLRLMYLFPVEVPDRLLQVMADEKTVLPYLDLPFQHADGAVLRRMRRGGDQNTIQALVRKLRRELPGLVLRTSLMTGFPGETEVAFRRMVGLVEQCRFERLGVFTFSPEEGSPAAAFENQVPTELAERRREELLTRQQPIASAYHRSLVGSELEVLVEGRPAGGSYIGRAWNQAPEVDGHTVLVPPKIGAREKSEPTVGEIVRARVIHAGPYDLEVEWVAPVIE